MLSDYLKKGVAYINEERTKLSLMHTDRPLEINSISPNYRKLTSLTLNYCNMRSLKGI